MCCPTRVSGRHDRNSNHSRKVTIAHAGIRTGQITAESIISWQKPWWCHAGTTRALTVTAECVETSGQAERLRRIGCDTGQGRLYSRAVAPERIAEQIGTRPPEG